jgi:zinc protease
LDILAEESLVTAFFRSRRVPLVLVGFVTALVPLAARTRQAAPANAAPALHIPFEKYTLSNGLTVVLTEDHATPTVSVVVMYHVGSKNEQVGRTGFAHLFEHVMFTGSAHVPYGVQDRLTEGVGGQNNGGTGNDTTTYYEQVPSNYLEHQLWIEADKMGWLLDSLDLTKYNAQRDIVKNERRQRVDNQPYGRAGELMAAAIYPAGHPYSWPVIGSMQDLAAATVDDVKKFFRLYYAPNNTTLVVSGDFNPAATKGWIKKYFDEIPRGQAITRPKAPPVTLDAEKRLYYEDRVQVPQLNLEWPTVGSQDDDNHALDILAYMLTGSRTARLTKSLLYDKELVSDVTASQNSSEDVGQFRITLTPRPGHTLAEIESAADAIVEQLKNDGPTPEELARSKAGLQFAFVSQLESNLGKGFNLAIGQTLYGDPGHVFSVDYPRYQAVTAADVKRVAQKFLGKGRVVLSVVPEGAKDQAAGNARDVTPKDEDTTTPPPKAAASAAAPEKAASNPTSFDRTVMPTAGPRPELRIPTWTKTTLANGARLVVSERHDLPLVSVSITMIGGADQFEPADKTGVGALASGMLEEGTTTRTGDEIANAMQLLGSDVDTAVGGEQGSIAFVSMSDKLEPMLSLTEDLIVNPTFPTAALERRRANTLVELQQAKDVTASVADVVFPKVVYSTSHPYGRSATETSVKAISRDDVLAFHKKFFDPRRAIITVVGDVTTDDVKRIADRVLGPWAGSGDSQVSFDYSAPPAPKPTTIYLVDKPGAAQSSFALGEVGPPRKTPDFFALRVMNTMFGELFQSRLNGNIREEKGYSYGVGSEFAFGRGPGPFRAGGDIITAKSDAALTEFMKEINGIRGARPVTDGEMEASKNSLVQSLPQRFSSVRSIGNAIAGLYVQDLPENYYQTYGASVMAVTKEDVVRVAQKYIDPAHLAIVIVGDAKTIEAPLKATNVAPIVRLDLDGNPTGGNAAK